MLLPQKHRCSQPRTNASARPNLAGTAEATLTHEWRGLKFGGSTLCFSHTQNGAKPRMLLWVGCGRCRYHAPFLSSVEHIRTLQRNFVADLTAEMVRPSSAHTHLPQALHVGLKLGGVLCGIATE